MRKGSRIIKFETRTINNAPTNDMIIRIKELRKVLESINKIEEEYDNIGNIYCGENLEQLEELFISSLEQYKQGIYSQLHELENICI